MRPVRPCIKRDEIKGAIFPVGPVHKEGCSRGHQDRKQEGFPPEGG